MYLNKPKVFPNQFLFTAKLTFPVEQEHIIKNSWTLALAYYKLPDIADSVPRSNMWWFSSCWKRKRAWNKPDFTIFLSNRSLIKSSFQGKSDLWSLEMQTAILASESAFPCGFLGFFLLVQWRRIKTKGRLDSRYALNWKKGQQLCTL